MRKLLKMIMILLLAGIVFCLGTLGMLIVRRNMAMNSAWQQTDYDAIIVLGAQVREDGTLSLQLTWRLDAAFEAWLNRNVPIVVCGAQGSNEPEPEAAAMKRYLVSKGVPEEQILTDDTSFNTRENIDHAAGMLDQGASVLIVTSDYHLPRAMALAEDYGLRAVGLGSDTLPAYWIKNYGRETLSWIKYWAEKYLHLNG